MFTGRAEASRSAFLVVTITASINWSNTPVRAVLDPPCSTSDRTGVSDRLGKASVGHAGSEEHRSNPAKPITGRT
ncbi:hypothetical protein PCASD_13078 [Puccinia coronata f. sp. avenae]|uniref:Uncharacterized protein n=1 Tax=Puccinia coronata f. sp. avenae TaxID=200324 RepID=A0A2N5SMN3_9BASI|nr:hypothetical protein PCASD_19538 [Puccinia coronata f. sp. avenae]PLW34093.1 hypothetical protein PCASD_13078 [Puccinia coronata f. sp. avenae]